MSNFELYQQEHGGEGAEGGSRFVRQSSPLDSV